jgi:oligopeptide/dipeptide ABC transporter ATP-binding protein
MNQPILKLQNLTKKYRLDSKRVLHAVEDVNLEIREGEVLGLVGESGCGKSTLGKMITGLVPRTSGEIHFRGEALPEIYRQKDFRKFARKIQMVFQDPASSLNPRMTVQDILSEGPLLHALWKKSDCRDKSAEWLTRVGLSPGQLSRYPHEFSGGQRQRIGIARALALEPELLVCDEPISALDVSVQAQVVNLLLDLKENLGLSLLFIAHDLSMVRFISQRIAVMYLGRLAEIGPADALFQSPAHPYTRSLLEANPVADPRFEQARRIELLSGEVPSPVNPGAGCRFAGRCPKTAAICRTQSPPWVGPSPDQGAACHFPS